MISSLGNEGPVNVLYNILKFIDYNSFDVTVLTLTKERDNSRIEDFCRLPISVIQLNKDGNYSLLSLFKLVQKEIYSLKPSIVHSHCTRSLLLMSLVKHIFKSMFTVHIYPGKQQFKMNGFIKGFLLINILNYFTKKCDMAVGCAESVSEQYYKEKGWIFPSVPNGSLMPLWKRSSFEKNKIRKELSLPLEYKYFIFIGRFSVEKNPDILLKVFSKLKDEGVGLIMLGSGPLLSHQVENKPDNIILPGFTTKVYDYLKASDFYISVSDVEGLANTILESMSVGLPMLLSDIPSHHEILNNFSSDEVGFIVDQHSVSNIIPRVRELANMRPSDISNISDRIQKVYAEKYTAETMSKNYQKLYHNIIK